MAKPGGDSGHQMLEVIHGEKCILRDKTLMSEAPNKMHPSYTCYRKLHQIQFWKKLRGR